MEIIEELYEVVLDRKKRPREGSYVSTLMAAGQGRILEKISEESGEVIEAAEVGSKADLIHEAADLFFHLLVLLGYKGITPGDVQEELKRRRK